jgi:hypothetical protein
VTLLGSNRGAATTTSSRSATPPRRA